MNIILAVVALIQVIVISASFVIAWTETISSLKIITNDGTVGTSIKTTANISSGDTVLNLDDYFRESANVHLASASSPDGVNFYFPRLASTVSSSNTSYRLGTVNDKNVNYISFSFKVKATDTNKQFYFRKTPTIKIGDKVVVDNQVRMTITVGNTTNIYTNKSGSDGNTIISRTGNRSGDASATILRAYKDYSSTGSQLFSVVKGSTKVVTISLWLEDPNLTSEYAGKQVTVENFELITTEQRTAEIKFVDRSSHNGDTGWQWVSNNNAVMWLYDNATKKSYEMKLDSSDKTNTTWVADIPYNSQTAQGSVTFYRCSPAGFGETESTGETVAGYWDKWQTNYTTESNIYTAYGSVKPNTVIGYGTWGEVELIKLDSINTEILNKANYSGYKITANTSKESEKSEMTFVDDCWQCYVPTDELNFTFTVKYGNTTKTVTAEKRPDLNVNNYTITSIDTGYWGEPVNVQTSYINGCNNTMGTVVAQHSSLSGDSIFVSKGTKVTLKATAKSGYAFDGWYTDESGSTEFKANNNVEVTVESDVIYYAKFAKAYDVKAYVATKDSTSNTNGGTVKVKGTATGSSKVETSVKEGGSITLVATQKTGYTFMGWYSQPNGGTLLTSSAGITELTISNVTKAHTAYARFKVNQISVTVHAVTNNTLDSSTGGNVKISGGTASSKINTKVDYDSSVTFVATKNNGYVFKGWYSAQSGGTRIIENETLVYNKDISYTNIYARFLKQYNIIATVVTDGSESNTNGGTVTDGSRSGTSITHTAEYNGSVTLTATVSDTDKYKFEGWYDDKTGGNQLTSDTSYTISNIQAGKNVYARFTTASRTLYFSNNYSWGGTISCYAWKDDKTELKGWPGTAMIEDHTNDQGQKVYRIELDPSYTNVIFTNGSNQTIDIDLDSGDYDGNGFYITGQSNGKFTVEDYSYNQ